MTNKLNSAGFTVIEFLVVLALGTLLLAISLPRLTPQGRGLNLRQITEIVNSTRLQALSTGESHKIDFNVNTNSLALLSSNTSRTYRFGRGLRMISARFGNGLKSGNTLVLYPSRTASPGKVSLSSERGTSCFIVQPLKAEAYSYCE